MQHFDAIIIGSGQAGNPLARALSAHGFAVAVIERRFPGGTCVNDGCTPSKTIDASARNAYLARRGADFGVLTGPISIDMKTVWQRKQHIVLESRANNTKGVEKVATLILGEASFAARQPGNGTYSIDVLMQNGSATQTLTADRVFLNTGERPNPPDLPGLDETPFLDSTRIMELQTVPEHLLVLGAGYIAMEFAQMFLRFGSKVTVLERDERIAAHEDEDIANCLRQILTEDGLQILTCTSADSVSGDEHSITLNVTTDDGPLTLHGSHLLVATGRTPNVESLHLDRVGIQQNEKGYIQVNDRLETTAKDIWALGDVKGGPAFTHISYDDFRIVRANLLEHGSRSTEDRIVPYVMFTDPELGSFGLNETKAKQQGIQYRLATMPMSSMARADEMDESRGMIKALVDPETGQILGATVLGVDGGELAAQLQIACIGKLPYTALRDAIFSHPTKAEALNNLFTNFSDGKP